MELQKFSKASQVKRRGGLIGYENAIFSFCEHTQKVPCIKYFGVGLEEIERSQLAGLENIGKWT